MSKMALPPMGGGKQQDLMKQAMKKQILTL